jgi:integrase
MPFSLDEVDLLISKVRKDYAPYLTVRLLTGLRPGEAHGLQWRDVDLSGGVFHIVRTRSRKGDGETKTEGSRRTIPMVPLVKAAFEAQKGYAIEGCPWVFHTIHGNPIDSVNFTNRIWYPLLRHLGLELRVPYQMRHTAATLMLAAGENPEWVASVLGHSTTEMLFRVYSRFVPNITRNDGTAFAGLVNGHLTPARAPLKASIPPSSDPPSALDLLNSLSPQELSDLIAKIKSPTALPTP